MTEHRHHHRARGRHERPPTARQLRYLDYLVDRCGETRAPVMSEAEASREIDRLKARAELAYEDRRREDREVSYDMATRTGDVVAAIRDDEIAGYGSSARWTSPGWM